MNKTLINQFVEILDPAAKLFFCIEKKNAQILKKLEMGGPTTKSRKI